MTENLSNTATNVSTVASQSVAENMVSIGSIQQLPDPLPPKNEIEEASESSKKAKSFFKKLKFWSKNKESQKNEKKEVEIATNANSANEPKKNFKNRVENFKEKFISLEIQRQVDVFLGILMLIAILFGIEGKVVVLPLAVAFLYSGLTGKKFFITYLFEKFSWNKKKLEPSD